MKKRKTYYIESCRPAGMEGSYCRVYNDGEFKESYLSSSPATLVKVSAYNKDEMLALLVEKICGLDVPVVIIK